MNEASAREVLLLQAFESVVPPTAHWGAEDKAWATRLAIEDRPAGDRADTSDFLARRARHAMQRLLPRQPALGRWLARRLWRPGWVAAAVAVGGLFGIVADSIGSGQRINLLAPPVWTVLAWNSVVYAFLLAEALRRAVFVRRSARRTGRLVRLTERLMRIGARLPVPDAAGEAPNTRAVAGGSATGALLRSFGARWLQASAPLSALRAATLLHAGAAALGAGLIAGLYARGLVLDYRAAWESTFLSAEGVHGLLTLLLAPASGLSGIGLPDVAGLDALRAVHGGASPGAPAAPWIHLYAVTLGLSVVLPRTLLAAGSAWLARRRAADFALPLTEPYFQRLLHQCSGERARVQVWPYARTPGPRAVAGLQRVLVEVLGDGSSCELAETTAFGGEDEPTTAALLRRLPASTATLLVALFDLVATPEDEQHGAFVRALAAHAPAGSATILWIDEAAFRQRFGSSGPRLAERRAAWARLAQVLGSVAVITDLEALETSTAAAALQTALARPV